jgi:L-aminopeptidase/D-esterase-like protein
VVLCPEWALGGVDVRGSAPGTRETDLLHPVNLVEKIQAAADCLSRAILHGVLAAESLAGMTAFRDLEPW